MSIFRLSGTRQVDPEAALRVAAYLRKEEQDTIAYYTGLGLGDALKRDEDGFIKLDWKLAAGRNKMSASDMVAQMSEYVERSAQDDTVPPEAAHYHERDVAYNRKFVKEMQTFVNSISPVSKKSPDEMTSKDDSIILAATYKTISSTIRLGREEKRIKAERKALAQQYGYDPRKNTN